MIAVKYVAFAVVATLLNLLFQFISFLVYDGFASLYVAMAAGTAAGLLSKYILDKKFIFYHKPTSKKNDATKFFFYSLTGVFTTFIFWGTEIAFDSMFDAEAAKYIGAVVGLAIGYTFKFFLDKTFVFRGQSI